jgi:hypothetical protein
MMMSPEAFNALMARARKTNAKRGMIERQAGFASPEAGFLDEWARTIICALHCGIKTHDHDALAEGLAMLVDLEAELRKAHTGRDALLYQPWTIQ